MYYTLHTHPSLFLFIYFFFCFCRRGPKKVKHVFEQFLSFIDFFLFEKKIFLRKKWQYENTLAILQTLKNLPLFLSRGLFYKKHYQFKMFRFCSTPVCLSNSVTSGLYYKHILTSVSDNRKWRLYYKCVIDIASIAS